MRRARLIDRATGRLRDCIMPELYRYCREYDKDNHGYKQIPYAGMAHAIGLPWLFAGSDNARSIVLLYDALTRLARKGLLRVKTATHTTVYVMTGDRRGA